MGKSHVELKPQGVAQRRLNIIYFIDSAKTRSLTIPLGRLNFLIAFIFLVFAWSIASIFVIAWLGQEQTALSARLKASLGTIFEYQSRFDNVYEVAYPPASQTQDAGFDPAPPGLRAEEYSENPVTESPSQSPQSATVASSPGTLAASTSLPSPLPGGAAPKEPPVVSPTPAPSSPQVAAPTAVPPAPASGVADTADKKPVSPAAGEVLVTVGNTNLEKGHNNVALHFELTNRSSQTRAEGYIWAIAEFVAEDGQKYFIGAPREIRLNANGDPVNPEKATYFGIKRFKKQSFTFPLLKGRSGIFTAVRIGVMDLSGEKRRTYRLSTEVRVR